MRGKLLIPSHVAKACRRLVRRLLGHDQFHQAILSGLPAEDWFVAADGCPAHVIADISEDRGSRRVVDLDIVAENYRQARALAGRPLIAVVKARAYGAGLVPLAQRLTEQGCDAFAVATLGAGMSLRDAIGAKPTILVLGYTPPDGLFQANRHDISLTLTDDDDLWPRYVDAAPQAGKRPIKLHLNLDTGMTRVGVPTYADDRVRRIAKSIARESWAELKGLYTHFPRSESLRENSPEDEAFTLKQLADFERTLMLLRADGHNPEMVHLANSPAIEQYPEACTPEWVTHARPGSLLHGMALDAKRFRRASRWETTFVRVERLGRDVSVGYGTGYQGRSGQYIGTLPVGYADGFMPSQREGEPNVVRADDVVLPVVSLAMDMCMVDLTPYLDKHGAPPEVRDVVVTLISDGPPTDPLSAESVSQRWGQHWAIALSGIRTRNTRVYASTRGRTH